MPPATWIDVSHWQSDPPNAPIDWGRVRAAGVTHAYIKATESTNFKDPAFPKNWTGAKAAGIKRGVYLFFRGDKAGAAQAKYFSDYVGQDRGEIVPAVDVEAKANGVSRATYTTRLRDCLLEVERLFGKKPAIYSSKEKLDTLTTQPAWIAEYDLWLAAPDAPEPPLPAGASAWWLHQYSWAGQVDGISGDVDLNRENTAPAPVPPPDDTDSASIRAHANAILGLV